MTTTSYSSLSQDALFHLAVQAMRRSDPETAVACLEEAASRSDATGQACYLLGAQYAQMERYDEAALEFERAVTLDAGLSIARLQYGLLLMTMGDAPRSAQVLASLLQLGEADPLAHFAAGLLHLARDEFANAQHCLACGIALNTENPPLNADMQKLLGRIKSVTATPAEPKPDNAEGASHILLSAYTGNTRN